MTLYVPRTATPLDFHAIPGLLLRAFEAIGAPLTTTQSVNLACLVGIETGQGTKCMNYNVGNITASPHWTGKAWRPPWFEADEAASDARLASLHEAMLRGTAPSAFRAYDSLEAGIADFAHVLTRNFPEVLEAAKETDANRFRLALGQRYSHDYISNSAVTATIEKLQKALGLAVGAVGGGGLVIFALLLWRAYRRA